tara:strand:- start:57 stop:557 length:501 start_codon:yes stop_codon:yes gene_type:complete
MALESMRQKASSLGYDVKVIEETVFGKSRDAAQLVGRILNEKYDEITRPFALICNTETTVSVKGSGKGGRNQQFVANLIDQIKGLRNCVAASIDSDGIDYLEQAGGAIADNNDLDKAESLGLNVQAHLNDNNTYELHKKLNNLLILKTTNTNVGDLQVYLIDKPNY